MIVFELPAGAEVLHESGGGVALHTQRAHVRQWGLKKAEIRAVARGFEHARQSYPSIRAYARAEQTRLRSEGIAVTVGQLTSAISRGPSACVVWEQLRDYLSRDWRETGDVLTHFDWTMRRLHVELGRLREHGYGIDRRPASRVNYRGWPWEYRLKKGVHV